MKSAKPGVAATRRADNGKNSGPEGNAYQINDDSSDTDKACGSDRNQRQKKSRGRALEINDPASNKDQK
jgi:hypothetical protein